MNARKIVVQTLNKMTIPLTTASGTNGTPNTIAGRVQPSVDALRRIRNASYNDVAGATVASRSKSVESSFGTSL